MAPGYVTADQVREGDRFEVSNGHRIEMCPAGGRGGRANLLGAAVLDSDPAVKSAAIDTGFTTHPKMLRAPDVSVGDIPDAPGWVRGSPQLAVEYADTGQDESQLQQKIKELSAASTVYVWVVRMQEPRCVEVYVHGEHSRTVKTGFLIAPGILKNRVPVRALYDREAAHEATLRNLLQRKGYESLEDLASKAETKGRREGTKKGRKEGLLEGLLEGQRRTILRIFTKRFGEPSAEVLEHLHSASSEMLDRITERIVTVSTIDELFV
jgi:Uma2 family endonuclease